MNFYNEYDKFAAQWLRNLIAAGHIAPGIVDERSIEDICPDELAGYAQCHFFAGVGIWPLALRRAGWPDTRPIWTGSCPCQPFSSAGKGAGFADERHLWPAFYHLISERRPERLLGEQVASKDVDPWIDLVQADLEALGYSVGAVAFPSASIGAPHIRDRTYWVADAGRGGLEAVEQHGTLVRARAGKSGARNSLAAAPGDCGDPGRLADTWRRGDRAQIGASHYRESQGDRPADQPSGCGVPPSRLADTHGGHAGAERQQRSGEQRQQPQDGGIGGLDHADGESTGRDAGSACGAQAQIDGAHARDDHGPGHAGADLCRLADANMQHERSADDPARAGNIGRPQQIGGLADANSIACGQGRALDGGWDSGSDAQPRPGLGGDGMPDAERPGPTNGFWRDADWLGCTDGKWRPVEPGSFPLAHGLPAGMGVLSAGQLRLAGLAGLDAASLKRAKACRIGSLRGAGNACNAIQAQVFIESVMEAA